MMNMFQSRTNRQNQSNAIRNYSLIYDVEKIHRYAQKNWIIRPGYRKHWYSRWFWYDGYRRGIYWKLHSEPEKKTQTNSELSSLRELKRIWTYFRVLVDRKLLHQTFRISLGKVHFSTERKLPKVLIVDMKQVRKIS